MDIVGKDIEREIYKWVKCLDETTVWKQQVRDMQRVVHIPLKTCWDRDKEYKVFVTIDGRGFFTHEIYKWDGRRLEFSHSNYYFAHRFFYVRRE